jgi:hypothetical protein
LGCDVNYFFKSRSNIWHFPLVKIWQRNLCVKSDKSETSQLSILAFEYLVATTTSAILVRTGQSNIDQILKNPPVCPRLNAKSFASGSRPFHPTPIEIRCQTVTRPPIVRHFVSEGATQGEKPFQKGLAEA